MRRNLKVFLGILGVGVLILGSGYFYKVSTGDTEVPEDLIATKSVEVSEEGNAKGGDPKSIDLSEGSSSSKDAGSSDSLYSDLPLDVESSDKVKKLSNGNYLVEGEEMTEEEFNMYLFENREPLNIVYTDEENNALLKEAEIFYNKVSASDGEIYENFINNYKSFKSDMSTDNYNLLKESLGSVEISLGYGE